MNYKLSLITILLLSSLNTQAKSTLSEENNSTKVQTEKQNKKEKEKEKEKNDSEDPETKALELKEKKISLRNTLKEMKLKSENQNLLEELQKIKWEKELLSESVELKELKEKSRNFEERTKLAKQIELLENESKLNELKNAKLIQAMDLKKAQWELKHEELDSKLTVLEDKEKQAKYTQSKPLYLDNPVVDENKLIISDRKVSLHGVITQRRADYIVKMFDYYNNKNNKQPIFLVIDSSPGGSVVAGYQIIKAMQSSTAPVYVVLRSYAASMAAVIVTLADKSYAYPNAIILHHQPSSRIWGMSNMTEQEESTKNLKKWWKLFSQPVADKMGISLDEFKRQMYKHSSTGDWKEFAEDAQKIHWVDHLVDTIVDTSVVKEPEYKKPTSLLELLGLEKAIDKNGKEMVYLPHLEAVDAYFLYDTMGYYRMR